jgi:mannose-1-phosphate guanylyltransferase
MIAEHKKKKSFITMSLFKYKTQLKYGVIDTAANGKVKSWKEKPTINANINMGCYIMEPGIFSSIPKNKPFGMDNVVKKAIKQKKKVDSIISNKSFLDIGDKETYEKANEEYRKRLGKI